MGYPGYQTLPRKTGTQGKDGDAAAESDLNLYGGVLTEKKFAQLQNFCLQMILNSRKYR